MTKKVFSLLCILSSTLLCYAQNIEGKWQGELNVYGTQLPLIFNFSIVDSNLKASFDSPLQQAYDVPIDQITFKNRKLILKISTIGASYTATLAENDSTFLGDFEQNGLKFPLELIQSSSIFPLPTKPQEPQEPFPYLTEDVVFENTQQNIRLAGTLSFPKGREKHPAVILISGSGPQDRNQELFNHKPFLVISDYLVRNGIAVLRYDDRGVAESGGEFKGSTTADFATDTRAAIAYLKSRKEIDANKIGLVGHSEGGIIAGMLAAQTREVGFIILLASPAKKGAQVLLKQQEIIGKAAGLSENYIDNNYRINAGAYEIIAQEKDTLILKDKLKTYFEKELKAFPDWNLQRESGLSDEKFISTLVETYTDNWMRFFMNYEPYKDLEKIRIPILALNGDKDLQVDIEQNFYTTKAILEKQSVKNSKAVLLEGLNHLFQESETGLPMEYGQIEQTFSTEALEVIKDWILKVVE